MGFYRKNIGGGQQIARIALGLIGAAAALAWLDAPLSLIGAAAAIGFAVTGVAGYCPLCAVRGLGAQGR